MSKRAVIAFGLVIVVGAAGYLAWSRHKASPDYALRQIASAIENRNRLRFQAYVDLDRLLPAVVDQLMGQAMLGHLGSEEGLEALGAAVGTALAEQYKPALTQAFRSAVLRAVEQGSLDSLYTAADSTADIDIASISSGMGARQETFQGLTDVQRDGDVALVGLRYHHEHIDTILVLQFRMERVNGRWMVVAPENLPSYMQDVERLRQSHLDRLNAVMRERVTQFLEFGSYQRTRERIVGYTMLEITQRVANRSDRPVHLSFGWLEPGEDSDADRQILLAERDELEPGASTTLKASIIGSSSSPVPAIYLSGDLEGFSTSISFVLGKGDSAEYIGPYSNWDEYLRRIEDPAGVAQRILRYSASADTDDPFEDILSHADEDPWTVSEDTNPLDDSPIVVLMNEARSGRTSVGTRPMLVVRCRNNTTEVYVNWNDYLGSDSPLVTYRVGDADQLRRRWTLSTDSRATFFPGSDIGLIKQLMGADRFVAEVTPYSESPVTAVFDLSGLAEKIGPLREACHW